MVITVDGDYGGGGREVARILAQMTGYTNYDDDQMVLAAAREAGIELEMKAFENFDESSGSGNISELKKMSSVIRKSGWISKHAADVLPLDEKVAAAERKVVNYLADKDNCIIHGRCANYYLSDRANVISIYITDEKKKSEQRIMNWLDCSAEEALKAIKKVNKRRNEYFSYFTDKDVNDPSNYDIVLNVSIYGEEGAAKLIKTMIEIREEIMNKNG